MIARVVMHSCAPLDAGALCNSRVKHNIAEHADDVTCKSCLSWPSLIRHAYRERAKRAALAVEIAKDHAAAARRANGGSR